MKSHVSSLAHMTTILADRVWEYTFKNQTQKEPVEKNETVLYFVLLTKSDLCTTVMSSLWFFYTKEPNMMENWPFWIFVPPVCNITGYPVTTLICTCTMVDNCKHSGVKDRVPVQFLTVLSNIKRLSWSTRLSRLRQRRRMAVLPF